MTGTVFYNSNRPERAVRLASLRLCNSCIINLPPNGLLIVDFFFIPAGTICFNLRRIGVNHKGEKKAVLHSAEQFVSVGSRCYENNLSN